MTWGEMEAELQSMEVALVSMDDQMPRGDERTQAEQEKVHRALWEALVNVRSARKWAGCAADRTEPIELGGEA